MAYSENGFDRPETNGPSRGGYNEYVADTSTIIKPRLQESAVPLLLDQGQQQHIAGQPKAQGNADSKHASSYTAFSHEAVDAWVPEMLNECCQSSIAIAPHIRNADSDYATGNTSFQHSERIEAWVPQMLSECCQENTAAIPLGHQGSVRGHSASSDEALVSSERSEAWVPSLLTQSSSDNFDAQPRSALASSDPYAFGKSEEQKISQKSGVPQFLSERCDQNANAQTQAQRSVDSSYATANTEIQRSDPVHSWVPELLNEACDQNVSAQPQYQQRSADSSVVARNTDILQERIAQNWVPELLSECCDQNVAAQRQTQQGSADSFVVAGNTDIIHEETVQREVPQLLGECCDQNINAQPQTQQRPADSFVVAGNTDIIHEETVQRGVPQLLGECCDQNINAQPQTQQRPADSFVVAGNTDIIHEEMVQKGVPQLLGECCDQNISAQPQTQQRFADSFVVAGNTDIIHEETVQREVPQLLGECCEEPASTQLTALFTAVDSPYATSNNAFPRTDTHGSRVPEFISESLDDCAASRAYTPESGSYCEEAGATQIAHAPKSSRYQTAAAETCPNNNDMACTVQRTAPQNYLSAAHPEIPHLITILTAPYLRSEAPLDNPIETYETSLAAFDRERIDSHEFDGEDYDSHEFDAEDYDSYEAEVVLAAEPELADSDIDAFQLRLEDLLADIRILQDRQQAEAERETALQLGYSQLFTLPGGFAALEAQPRQDRTDQSLLIERARNSSRNADVWNAIETQTALTQATPPSSIWPSTPSAASPWSGFQQPLMQSIEARRAPKAAQPTESSWSSLTPTSARQTLPLSSAQFTNQSPVQKKVDTTDPLCKEWQAQQRTEKFTPDIVLDQLHPDENSSWLAVEQASQTVAPQAVVLNVTSNPEVVKTDTSPWNTWEAASPMTTKMVEASFEPSAASAPTEKVDEALTIWNQWTVTEPIRQQPLWSTWEERILSSSEGLASDEDDLDSDEVKLASEAVRAEMEQPPSSAPLLDLLSRENFVLNNPQDTIDCPSIAPLESLLAAEPLHEPEESGQHATSCLGPFENMTVHQPNFTSLESVTCMPTHQMERADGFAGRTISPEADRICTDRACLFATPTDLNIPQPPPPYLGGDVEGLLETIAQLHKEEEQAQRRVVFNIQAPNELGGRQPLTSPGSRLPAPKSPLADKVAGFSSDEEDWQERVDNMPLRRGVVQSPPGIGKNLKAVRVQFAPTALDEEPYTPPPPTPPAPRVIFKPAGVTAVCEDESFCSTGTPRVTQAAPPPQHNQEKLGPRSKNTAETDTRTTTGNSSFRVQVKQKVDPNSQQNRRNTAGPRAKGPLGMLRKVLNYFLPDAYASEPCESTNAFECIGAPTFDRQGSSITVVDDESWWYEPIAAESTLPDEDNDLVVGAREGYLHADPLRTGQPVPRTIAGIDDPQYKEFSLGVTRQGHLWSHSPQTNYDEDDLDPQWEVPEPFTSATAAPEAPDHRDYELEEYALSELHSPVQKKNYDWYLDELEEDPEEDRASLADEVAEDYPEDVEDQEWADWEPEVPVPAVRVHVDALAPPKVVPSESVVLSQPQSTDAIMHPKPAPQLDPLTPSRDLNPSRNFTAESLSSKLITRPPQTDTAAALPLPPSSKGFTMNFPNVNIKEFIRFVSRETEKNFIYNEDELDFNVTIVSAEPTSLDNIMAALLQELRIHGLSLIDQGNTLIIHRSGANSPAKMWADETHVDEAEIVTRVFRLKNVPLSEMAPVVKQMLSDKALVQVLPESQSLIVTDLAENITRLSILVDNLDVPAKTFELGQYVGINNFIENLIPLAEQILRPLAGHETLTFVPHLATNSVFIIAPAILVQRSISVLQHLDHLEGQTQILTLDKLVPGNLGANQGQQGETPSANEQNLLTKGRRRPFDLSPENLLRSEASHLDIENEVNSNEDIHAQIREAATGGPIAPIKTPEQQTIEELNNTKFYIHRLQYRKGDQLVDALSRIAESLRYNEKANIDLINAITSTQWIESTNAIMVTGTQLALDRVKQLILEIDVPLRQILLEMLVIETTVADGLNFSVDWSSDFADKNVAGAQAWQSEASGSPLLKLPTQTSTVGQLTIPTLGQQGFQLGVIGQRIVLGELFFSSLGLLVSALHTVTDVNIKLNPKIVVEDNTPAELFVGENTAFLSQAITNNLGNVIANNVEFRDVGTRLSVTPLIGNGNMITLVIALEDSQDISASTSGGSGGGIGPSGNTINPGPTTATTRTTTKIHVPNKFFVVLSGMIREEKTVLVENLPCLGGIPILAGFSKSKANTVAKRNLMVFIRPEIIETQWEYNEITRRQQNIYRMNSEDKKPPWQYEVDEALEFFHLPRFNDRECCVPGVNEPNTECCQFWADPLWD